jgi:predicted nucleic acid-binding protein
VIHAVADASVAVKWFLPPTEAEQDHDQAVALLQGVKSGRIALREPPHWLAEVAAVLTRLAPASARQDIENLWAMRIPVMETPEIYVAASKLAVLLDQHLFDTLYHAVALLGTDCTLVTADERYYRKARKEGSIKLLSDFEPTGEERGT